MSRLGKDCERIEMAFDQTRERQVDRGPISECREALSRGA
jgi:hypothetical protein